MADLWYNMYFSLVKRHSEKLTGQLSFIFQSTIWAFFISNRRDIR